MKVKVTTTLNPDNWHRFRMECLRRKMSASELIDALIAKQLSEWAKEKK